MKKIIFVLMFSLGLVSATNIDVLCGEKRLHEYEIKEMAKAILGSNDWNAKSIKLYNTLYNLMVSHYSKEFKIDNKESVCVYVDVIDKSFENTQLTQDDIEQFERYTAENGWYREYKELKEYYLRIVKFYKYYHNYLPSTIIQEKKYLNQLANHLQFDNIVIETYKYVYGKEQGEYILEINNIKIDGTLDRLKNKVENYVEVCKSKDVTQECQQNNKILPSIVQWAESKINESKQKEAK